MINYKTILMKCHSLFVILLSCVAIGCSTTSTVSLDSPGNVIEEINELSQNRDIRIRSTDGKLSYGTDLHIRYDSVQWKEMDTEKAKMVPLDEVAQIQIINRNKGAKRGLLYGLAAAGAGAIFGYFSYNEEEAQNSMVDFGADGAAMLMGTLVGLPGVVSGLWIGAGRGYLINYNFEEHSIPDTTEQVYLK